MPFEIFTIVLGGKETPHFSRKDFTESWFKLGVPVKVYTEEDTLIQEALSLCPRFLEICKQSGRYNFLGNLCRVYILGKKTNALYVDSDVYLFPEMLNLDTNFNYFDCCDFVGHSAFFSSMFVGNSPLKVDNTINYIIDTVHKIDRVISELNLNAADVVDMIGSFFSLGELDDNQLVFQLAKDNAFKTFPKDVLFHAKSFTPLAKDFKYFPSHVVIHTQPMPERWFHNFGYKDAEFEKLSDDAHVFISNENFTQIRDYRFKKRTCEVPNKLDVETIKKLILNIFENVTFSIE